ncbi:MAG: protocatechuate 3,4-dioxygenase [Rhodospirillaceae bacterium]
MDRRQILSRLLSAAGFVSAAGLLPGALRAAAPLAPTPAQTEGPYYPIDRPADAGWNLLGGKPGGTALALSGRVLDTAGRPIAGARVEIWQADHQGIYDHPHATGRARFDPGFRGFGRATADAEGRYWFLTQVPVRYTGRPPHIHAKVFVGGNEALTTQLYIPDHPDNRRDGIFAGLFGGDRSVLMMDIRDAGSPGPAAKATAFDFVIQG